MKKGRLPRRYIKLGYAAFMSEDEFRRRILAAAPIIVREPRPKQAGVAAGGKCQTKPCQQRLGHQLRYLLNHTLSRVIPRGFKRMELAQQMREIRPRKLGPNSILA